MTKKNLPRFVTLVDRLYYGHATVLFLRSEGSRNYHGQVYLMEDGKERQGRESSYEKDRYLLVEGARHSLVTALRAAKEATSEAVRKWEQDKRDALYDFEARWREEHPCPRVPTIQELLAQTEPPHYHVRIRRSDDPRPEQYEGPAGNCPICAEDKVAEAA